MTMTNYPHAFRDLPPVTAVEIKQNSITIFYDYYPRQDGVSLETRAG